MSGNDAGQRRVSFLRLQPNSRFMDSRKRDETVPGRKVQACVSATSRRKVEARIGSSKGRRTVGSVMARVRALLLCRCWQWEDVRRKKCNEMRCAAHVFCGWNKVAARHFWWGGEARLGRNACAFCVPTTECRALAMNRKAETLTKDFDTSYSASACAQHTTMGLHTRYKDISEAESWKPSLVKVCRFSFQSNSSRRLDHVIPLYHILLKPASARRNPRNI